MIKRGVQDDRRSSYSYIPLHQQALAWGVSKKVKLAQRADNSVLLYYATKEQ
jgi:peptide/nickel transport system substrate-binding protein